MRDNQFSSDFLASCGRGLTDIYGYLLNLTLSHFLYGCYAALHELPRETDEFNLDVLKMEFDVKTAQKDLVTWHQRLSTWLSVYFPTPVIETNVIVSTASDLVDRKVISVIVQRNHTFYS
jgi:hypothetical protein